MMASHSFFEQSTNGSFEYIYSLAYSFAPDVFHDQAATIDIVFLMAGLGVIGLY